MRSPRKSTYVLGAMAVLALLFAVMTTHAFIRRESETAGLRRTAEMAGEGGLTDLCLFTEASYTRNPSLTDLHTPFQDHPLSLEHFPSGSLMPPPAPRK